jgi:hypothetical protein
VACAVDANDGENGQQQADGVDADADRVRVVELGQVDATNAKRQPGADQQHQHCNNNNNKQRQRSGEKEWEVRNVWTISRRNTEVTWIEGMKRQVMWQQQTRDSDDDI